MDDLLLLWRAYDEYIIYTYISICGTSYHLMSFSRKYKDYL